MASIGSRNEKRVEALVKAFKVSGERKHDVTDLEASKEYEKQIKAMSDMVKSYVSHKDYRLHLAVEAACIKYEADNFTNSKAQKKSLQTALAQVPAAQKATESINKKRAYQEIANESFGKKLKTKDHLPNDGMREFLASQQARMQNLDKGWATDAEKAFFQARHAMLKQTEKLYAEEQRKVLGLDKKDPDPGKSGPSGPDKPGSGDKGAEKAGASGAPGPEAEAEEKKARKRNAQPQERVVEVQEAPAAPKAEKAAEAKEAEARADMEARKAQVAKDAPEQAKPNSQGKTEEKNEVAKAEPSLGGSGRSNEPAGRNDPGRAAVEKLFEESIAGLPKEQQQAVREAFAKRYDEAMTQGRTANAPALAETREKEIRPAEQDRAQAPVKEKTPSRSQEMER